MRVVSPRRRRHVADLLPAYLNGTLDPSTARFVANHVPACPACSLELDEWRAMAGASEALAPHLVPSDAVLARVWAGIEWDSLAPGRLSGRPSVVHLWQVLLGQAQVVNARLWTASAVVLGLGFALAASGQVGAPGLVLQLVAPIVAAVGVSLVYGPEVDPGLEVALATPTSPRLVLLARLTLVFGYDLALSLAGTAGLAIGGHAGIWSLSLDWLGPMLFLSALALVLSLRLGPPVAMSTALVLWMARVFVAAGGGQGLLKAQGTELLIQAWSTNVVTLAGAALLVVVALTSVQRQERVG